MKKWFFVIVLFLLMMRFSYGKADVCIPDGVNYTIFALDIDYEIDQEHPVYQSIFYVEDSCQNKIYNVTVRDDEVNYGLEGTYPVYVYYKLLTKSVLVNVYYDITKPIISVSEEITIEVNNHDFNFRENVTVFDNRDNDITDRLMVDESHVNIGEVGEYIVTYSAKDSANNEEIKEVKVNVVDTTAPVISDLNDRIIEVNIPLSDIDWWQGVIVSDNSNKDVEKTVNISDFNINELGTYNVTYKVTDNSGNFTEIVIEVTVVDTTPPEITVSDMININILLRLDEYDFLSLISATDNYDGILPNDKIFLDKTQFVFDKTGIYPLYIIVIDRMGNEAIKEILVRVYDEDKPVITGAVDLSIPANMLDYNYLNGIVATDLTDGDITDRIIVYKDNVDLTKIGEYPLYYIVFDSSGNHSIKEIKVTVYDNEKPTIAGVINVTLEVFSNYNPLAGITAYDNLDGDITNLITYDTDVDYSVVGVYDITYRVIDSNHNSYEVQATISIVDTTGPVISGYKDIRHKLGDGFDLLAILEELKAIDNYDGDITHRITFSEDYDINKEGSYLIKISVTDNNGNNSFVLIELEVYVEKIEEVKDNNLYYIIGGITMTLLVVGALAFITRKKHIKM